MHSHPFLASLLAGAIGICSLTAGQQLPEEKTVSLKGLEARCRKLLEMQMAVHEGTKRLHQVIEANADKTPGPRDKVLAVQLAGKEKAIIAEATAIIDMLNAEGAAVAFAEVFEELQADMKRVQGRLESTDVGSTTEAIQKNIIETLQEMIGAVKPSR